MSPCTGHRDASTGYKLARKETKECLDYNVNDLKQCHTCVAYAVAYTGRPGGRRREIPKIWRKYASVSPSIGRSKASTGINWLEKNQKSV